VSQSGGSATFLYQGDFNGNEQCSVPKSLPQPTRI